MVVAHNLMAVNAKRQYGMTINDRAKSTEKLSSGYRINRAADDAAGLAISEKMRHLIRGLDRGARNVEDGISLIQIADGALAEVHDMLHRMTELSVQAANDTNTNSDRSHLQHEINQLVEDIDRISETTEYNTMPLFISPKPADGSTPSDSVAKLVNSVSGEKKAFAEEIQMPNGRYYPAAILDFGNINSSNISLLTDKYFTFTCNHGCGEVFKFKMFDDPGVPNSVQGQVSNYHTYNININGMTTGTEIIHAIQTELDTNKPSKSSVLHGVGGTGYDQFGNVAVSHTNALFIQGDKLIIYDFDTGRDLEHYAEKVFANNVGNVDCNNIMSATLKASPNSFWIQCSDQRDDAININVEKFTSTTLTVNGLDVRSYEGASDAIDRVAFANDEISRMRAYLGACQNRLEHTYNNDRNKEENTQAAESRLRDTDMAKQMTDLSKLNILSQVGEAMIAQANLSHDGILALLQ